MPKHHSIENQATQKLRSMAAFGTSKHLDKLANDGKPAQDKIYSYSTMDNYRQAGKGFVQWAKSEYGCRDLEDARLYVGDYLQHRIDEGKSAWTVCRDAAALGKLYQTKSTSFGVKLPTRSRANVTQHRTNAEKGHFSESKNADLVTLCKATGLRRHEIPPVTADKVMRDKNGHTVLTGIVGKGGKVRVVPVLPQYKNQIKEMAERAAADNRPLVEHIPKYAPCHVYRAEYARKLYALHARDVKTIDRAERYDGRRDLAGQSFDKAAMSIVTAALGHNRDDIVTNYIGH